MAKIIHWIAIFIEQHERIARTCHDGADFSIKGKSLHPTVLTPYLSSYIEYKSRVEKDNNKCQLLIFK